MHTISASDNKVFNVLVNLLTDTGPFTCSVVIKDLEARGQELELQGQGPEFRGLGRGVTKSELNHSVTENTLHYLSITG